MTRSCSLLLAALACACVTPRPLASPTADARTRAALTPEEPLPTVPHQFTDCRLLTWATIGSAVVGAMSIYVVGTGVDTLNPDPTSPLSVGLRRLKFGAGLAGAGATVLTVSLTSLLGQCRDDQAKAGQ